jgi:Tol biopolymer transport system component
VRTIQAPAGRYTALAISPDEAHLAAVKDVSATESDLWIIDLDRGGARRLTAGGEKVDGPAWSPDGTQVAYVTNRTGRWEIVVQPAAGGEPRVIETPDATLKYVTSWSPDGRLVMGHLLSERSGWDLWTISTDGSGEPKAFVASPYDESNPRISPDGHWVSYMSVESGRPEIYIQAFPQPGPRYLVSAAGGDVSTWSRDGRRLLYRSLEGLPFIVELHLDGGVRAVRVGPMLTAPPTDDLQRLLTGSVSPDLDSFYASIEGAGSSGQSPFTIVQNWRSALEPQ